MSFLSSISTEKAIYENNDSRVNVFELDQKLKSIISPQAASVACMVHKKKLIKNVDGTYELKEKVSLSEYINKKYKYPLHSDEKFSNEYTVGFGTAFLVSKDTVITAAHCVCKPKSDDLDDTL